MIDPPKNLPDDVRAGLIAGYDEATGRFDPWKVSAAIAVFDDVRVPPVASALTPMQRALAVFITEHDKTGMFHRLPRQQAARRRWLGLDPPGVLEADIAVDVDGTVRTEPLWRALLLWPKPTRQVLASLPLRDRVERWWAIQTGNTLAYGLLPGAVLDVDELIEELSDDLTDELRDWAPGAADMLIADKHRLGDDETRTVVFLALTRSGLVIEPRWELLLPLSADTDDALMREGIAAIATDRRNDAIVAALAVQNSQQRCSLALHFLRELRDPMFLQVALGCVDQLGAPQRASLDRVRSAAAGQPAMVAVVDKLLSDIARPIALRTVQVDTPRTDADLDDTMRAQVLAAGRLWHRKDVSLNDLLHDPNDVLTLFGLEHRAIADADGVVRYDAWRFIADGIIFFAGTTTPAAFIVQEHVEHDDEPLRDGLQLAIDQVVKATQSATMKTPTT